MRTVDYVGFDGSVVDPFLASRGFRRISQPGESPSYESPQGGKISTFTPEWANAGHMTASAPVLIIRFSNGVNASVIEGLRQLRDQRGRR